MRRGAKPAMAALACALCLATGAVGIVASYAARAHVAGTVGAGKVEIALAAQGAPADEPLTTEGEAECRFLVENRGADCWVRIWVNHSVSGGAVGEVSWLGGEECVSQSWAHAADGWWYLTEPLSENASASFTSALCLPLFEQVKTLGGWGWAPISGEPDSTKWSEPSPDPDDAPTLRAYSGAEGSRLVETVTVEAVQAAHFEPDFSAYHPWGAVGAEAGAEASLGKEEV